jgi:hypothetical protein
VTQDEMLAHARALVGPEVDVQLIDSADVVQDGVRHQHIVCAYRNRSTGRGNTIDFIVEEPEEARENPFGVPLWGVAAGVAVLSAGAWVALRLKTRAALKNLLEGSETVEVARTAGLITWTAAERAAETVGFLSAQSADAAYAEILAELRALLPVQPGDMVNLTDDAKRVFQEKTGVDPNVIIATGTSAADSVYQSLPDVPIVDTTSWWEWATGTGSASSGPAVAKTGTRI